MKQEPFVLHDHIAPLQMWMNRYAAMIRETAALDLPTPWQDSLHRLADDIEKRSAQAWNEIEQAVREELQQKRFGHSNNDGGQHEQIHPRSRNL